MQGTSPDDYRVLVSLHNIVNLPSSLVEQKDQSERHRKSPDRTDPQILFDVEVALLGGAASPKNKVAVATFTVKDIQSLGDHFEVKLDDRHRQDQLGRGPCGRDTFCEGSREWTISTRSNVKFSFSVTISERQVYEDGSISVAMRELCKVSPAAVLDAKHIVESRKQVTRIIGTTMGQVGLSVCVSPLDKDGYRARIDKFFRKYNPSGLHLSPVLVSSVGEVETFTRMHRKYNLMDYKKRLQKFFEVYGPDHMVELDSILEAWKDREEEFLKVIVLENGPELCDVDVSKRLTGYLKRYNLTGILDPQQLLRDHQRSAATTNSSAIDSNLLILYGEDGDFEFEALFRTLVAKYGPEPDPRSYLFPPVSYKPPQLSLHQGRVQGKPDRGPVAIVPKETEEGGVEKMKEIDGTEIHAEEDNSAAHQLPPLSTLSVPTVFSKSLGTNVKPSHSLYQSAAGRGSRSVSAHSSIVSNATTTLAELWSGLCERIKEVSSNLNNDHQQKPGGIQCVSDLFYMTENEFGDALFDLGYHDTETRLQLLSEWTRRCSSCLVQKSVSQGDSQLESIKNHVLSNCGGLHELNLSILGGVSLTNSEHENCFLTYVRENLKQKTVQRFLIVGEYTALLDMARHGVKESSLRNSILGSLSPVVLQRKPFGHLKGKTTTAVLVCDVAVGRCRELDDSEKASEMSHTRFLNELSDGTGDLLDQYDSVELPGMDSEKIGACLAVFNAKQVLPRYLVPCVVDPALVPCACDPSRHVEYYVPTDNSFICSHCAVNATNNSNGRPKEVILLADAATQARAQLTDMQRDAHALQREITGSDEGMDRELTVLSSHENCPILLDAQKEADRIREEAEIRAQAVIQEAEHRVNSQKTAIMQTKKNLNGVIAATRSFNQDLAEMLLPGKPPTHLVESLVTLQNRRNGVSLDELRRQAFLALQPEGTEKQRVTNNSKALTDSAEHHDSLEGGTEALENHQAALFSKFQSLKKSPRAPRVQTPSHSNREPNLSSKSTAALHDLVGTPRDTHNNNMRRGFVTPGPSGNNVVNESKISFTSTPLERHSSQMPQTNLKATKSKITHGWTEFRRGNKEESKRIWMDVFDQNANTAVGARARAYIAEAVDRDFESASRWYEKALRYDPKDVMTLYNYAVLMESVLGRRREALHLFQQAHALGDEAAGRRALQLRAEIQ